MDVMILVLRKVLALVREIPATFWGVVFGSFFTLIGIMLTNRHNNKRQRKERGLALRNEVYLTAIEAMSAGISATDLFAKIEIPESKLTETYVEKSPSIGKVYIIAGEETFKAVAHFTSELNAAYNRLLPGRDPLSYQRGELSALTELAEGIVKKLGDKVELMKQKRLDGTLEPRLLEAALDSFEFEKRQIYETGEKSSVLSYVGT